MRYVLGAIFVALFACSVNAQQTKLSGNVVNSATLEPLAGITVRVIGQSLTTTTDNEGEFNFDELEQGNYTLLFTSSTIISRDLNVEIIANQSNVLKDIKVVYSGGLDNMALVGVIDEEVLNENSDEITQEISSLVILSNDPFISNVGYRLSQFRFRLRNYTGNYSEKFINGVNFNDQYRGTFNYSSIGALNNLTREGDIINYQNLGRFSFGDIGGSENLNMRAGSYTRGAKITASYMNSNYYLRGMAHYSTGLMDNGWAVTFGAGLRYSHEGHIDGTFYRNFSYMFGIEKQWNNGEHSLSFTTFGSPVERGQQGSSFQESYDLLDNNLYNPNWGYQNGKKRNSRIVKSFDPTGILSHIWRINNNATLTSGVSFHYGLYGATALNWYNGADPRPDYYRYLPSYYSESPEVFNYYTELWKSKDPSVTQVNWDNLYKANQLSVLTGNGSSIYMVEDRRSDLLETAFNSVFNIKVSNKSSVTAGVEYRYSSTKQYKTVNDLLGGTYVLDIDKFAESDFAGNTEIIQNDLNRPDRKVYEGDRFGYDYNIDINSANIWFQNEYTVKNIDFYYGSKLTYTGFTRDGKMRNGRFPNNSYGKGKSHDFFDYAMKAGLTAKITGRHILIGNISYQTKNPLPYNSYISPRITDNTVNLESEKIFSADVSYVFSLPSFSGRISAYQTNFYDQIGRWSYYYDSQRTFVNHILKGMDKISRGFELGLKYKMTNNWSFDLAGTISEHYYSNNPEGVISFENGSIEDMYETVYMKDYYVGGAPQFAGTFGVNYFYDYWFFSLNLNGISRNYIDIAPMRRLASNYQLAPGYEGIDPNNEADMETYRILTNQEKFNDALTLDLSIGKILYLKNRHSINFNLSLNNILNKKDIRTGGYESGRIDLSNPYKFNSKYYYMQGISCFLNVSYNF